MISGAINPCPTNRQVHIYIHGDYDTLHDLLCQRRKPHKSVPRNEVINRFKVILTKIAEVDKLMMHLESFCCSDDYADVHSLPETHMTKGKVPLFRFEDGGSKAAVNRQGGEYPQNLIDFWTPVYSLDVSIWHRSVKSNIE